MAPPTCSRVPEGCETRLQNNHVEDDYGPDTSFQPLLGYCTYPTVDGLLHVKTKPASCKKNIDGICAADPVLGLHVLGC